MAASQDNDIAEVKENLDEENKKSGNILRIVVLQMDDLSAQVPDPQKQWGVGNWKDFPPIVRLVIGDKENQTSPSSSLAWQERFLFKISGRSSQQNLEILIDQNRSILWGGNISIVRGWFSLENINKTPVGTSWIEQIILEPNPALGINPNINNTTTTTTDVTSSSSPSSPSKIKIELKLQVLYHDEPNLLLERCHQGAEDSEDSEDDDDDDKEEEGGEEDGKTKLNGDKTEEKNSKETKEEIAKKQKKASRLKLKKKALLGKKKNNKLSKEVQEEMKKDLEEINKLSKIHVSSGIHEIVVHILEARSLKGSTGLAASFGSGVPDPLISVTVGSEKKRTRVLPAVENAVFDDTFKFELDLTEANFGQHSVEIEAVDTHTPLPGGEAIGKFVVDFESVYFANPQHELYRQWVGLDSSDEKGKTCGFILVSISIIGPGENLPFHDRKAELALEAKQGGGSMQVMTNGGDKSYETLKIRCHRAVGIPPMDFSRGRWTGLDALVQLSYASLNKQHTRTRPKFIAYTPTKMDTELDQGCGFIGCAFDTEIRLPVALPTVIHNVQVGISDADPGLMDMIGFGGKNGVPVQSVGRGIDLDLNEIRQDSQANPRDFDKKKTSTSTTARSTLNYFAKRNDENKEDISQAELDAIGEGGGTTRFGKPFWKHLYGAPMPCVGDKKIYDVNVHQSSLAYEVNAGDPLKACSYRGSLLMSARLEKPIKVKGDPPKVKRLRADKLNKIEGEPLSTRHVVRCAVYGISGLPDTSGNLGGLISGMGTRYSLVVSMGHAKHNLGSVVVAQNSLAISSGANKEGLVIAWPPPKYGSYDVEGVGTTWPTSQLPEIFITLYKHESRGSVYPLDAEGVLQGGHDKGIKEESLSAGTQVAFTRFTADMLWGVEGDDVKMAQPRWLTLRGSPVAKNPLTQVQLLVRLGVDTEEVAKSAHRWPVLDASITTPFSLFVHLFQARGLPPADENGRLDPYIKCDVAGETIQSPTHAATTNPQFATSISFDNLQLPTAPELTAPLRMSVFDYDQWSSHDEVGRIEYPLSLARQATTAFDDIETELMNFISLLLAKAGEEEVSDGWMTSPFESQERGGGIVDVCITCHKDYLWLWVSVSPKQIDLMKALEVVKHAKEPIIETLEKTVKAKIRNVPLRAQFTKPVHVEVLTYAFPKQISGNLDIKHMDMLRKKIIQELDDDDNHDDNEFATKISEGAIIKTVVGAKLNRLVLTPEGRPSLELTTPSTCFQNKDPHWLSLRGCDEEALNDGSLGEVLFRVELVQMIPSSISSLSPSPPPMLRDLPILKPPESLTSVPSTKQWLDIMVLGCRDLKSSDHLPISDVVVKFTCAGQILVNVLDQDTSELQFGENQSSSDNQDGSNNNTSNSQVSNKNNGGVNRYIETKPSHKPSRSNPNIVERFVIPVMLPKDPSLSPSLEIAVLDRRPIIGDNLVGTAAIDLCACTPRSIDGALNPDFRRPGTVTLEDDIGNPFMAAGASKEMRDAFKVRTKRRNKMKKDKLKAKLHADRLKKKEKKLQHKVKGVEKEVSSMLKKVKIIDDDDDDKETPPEWMQNRKTLPKEFEAPVADEVEGAGKPVRPYDVVGIMRGSDFDLLATGSRQIGILKIVVRVSSSPPAFSSDEVFEDEIGFSDSASETSSNKSDKHHHHAAVARRTSTIDTSYVDRWWSSLGNAPGLTSTDAKARANVLTRLRCSPPAYICRCYVLEGRGLSAKDLNGKSDPYLRARVGDGAEVNARDRVRYATLDPDFFTRLVDIPIALPGPSTLDLSVWDYDAITGDDHIGSTLIDLEDRWYSTQWRESSDNETRPLEWRSLWSPSSTFPQGRVSVITEIMTTHEARVVPKWPIEKPEPEDWEVRVVVWKARKVPASDLGGFSDTYMRLFLVGHESNAQQTDTHLRSQHGKSSFNYRIKLPLQLPLSSMAEGAGRLVIQVWDFDLLEGDDMIGTASLDLSRHMFAAQKRHMDFVKESEAAAEAASKIKSSKKNKTPKAPVESSYCVFIENEKREERLKQEAKENTLGHRMFHKKKTNNNTPSSSPSKHGRRKSKYHKKNGIDTINEETYAAEIVQDADYDDVEQGGLTSLVDFNNIKEGALKFQGDAAEQLIALKPEEDSEPEFGEFGDSSSCDDDSDDEDGGEGDGGESKKEVIIEQPKKKVKKAPKPSFMDTLNAALGNGPDPENSLWVPFKRRKGNKEFKAGEVLLSIEILPKSLANGTLANGVGRAEPNLYPELPPPTGRFNPSKLFNPIYMVENIIGTDLLIQVAALVACGGGLAGLVIVFPALLAWCQFAASTTAGWGWWLTLAFIILSVIACCGVRYQLIRNANFDPCRSSCKKTCPMDFARPHDSDDDEDDELDEGGENDALLSNQVPPS